MDRCNNQYNGFPRRQQMSSPPCMNMNYESSTNPQPFHMAPSCIQHQRSSSPDMPIGMGYVPIQKWMQTYPMDQALKRGTIFPELDYPFLGRRCCR